MDSKESNLLLIYIAIDIILLNLSMGAAYYLNLGLVQNNQFNLQYYMLQANLAWIIVYFFFIKHNLYLRDAFRHRVLRIIKRIASFVIVLTALAFVFMKGDVSRTYILFYILIFLLMEIFSYWVIYAYLGYRRNHGWHTKRILLVGYSETSQLFRKTIETTPMLGYKFVGYVKGDTQNLDEIPSQDRPNLLGDISQLAQIIKEKGIQEVFSVLSFSQKNDNLEEQLIVCNQIGVRLYLIAENQRWIRKTQDVVSLGNFYILNPQHIPLDDVTNRVLKRIFDIFFSLFVILCFGWNVLLLIIGIIKLTSKGPAFFVQERTGLDNLPFYCYKFRSMYINKESDKKQATKNDSRITPFGRFMRRWNIDELPQFINVLCGQMSVVGPRPHMLSHTEQYSALIKYYKVRHYVKPGITGWAQVNGWRGETDETWKMEERVKYDMNYIENWSFPWDLKIIWLTIFGKNVWQNAS